MYIPRLILIGYFIIWQFVLLYFTWRIFAISFIHGMFHSMYCVCIYLLWQLASSWSLLLCFMWEAFSIRSVQMFSISSVDNDILMHEWKWNLDRLHFKHKNVKRFQSALTSLAHILTIHFGDLWTTHTGIEQSVCSQKYGHSLIGELSEKHVHKTFWICFKGPR